MAHTEYYGKKQGTTYLELYHIPTDGGDRIVHHRLCDEDAYATGHLAFLFKEILSYHRLSKREKFTLDQIDRKEKNLIVYLLLASFSKTRSIMELGSSLFELIDGLEIVHRYFKNHGSKVPLLDLHSLTFEGIEISSLLRDASLYLHPEYTIRLFSDIGKVRRPAQILYERNVSSYVFESPEELSHFVNKTEIAFMNLFVSRGKTFVSTRLGKALTYFSLEELVSYLDKPLYHLFGTKAPSPASGHDLAKGQSVVEGFFFCCKPEIVEIFMALSRQDPEVEAYFIAKEIVPKPALTLL